jgi:hypothetical protein
MRWVLALPVMLLTGCIPPIQGTMNSIAYELNRDTNTWTKQECRVKVLSAEKTQTVCSKQTISSPPDSVIKGE